MSGNQHTVLPLGDKKRFDHAKIAPLHRKSNVRVGVVFIYEDLPDDEGDLHLYLSSLLIYLPDAALLQHF